MGSLSPNQPTGRWWGVPRGTSASAVLLLIVFGTEGTATYRNARTPPTPRYGPLELVPASEVTCGAAHRSQGK